MTRSDVAARIAACAAELEIDLTVDPDDLHIRAAAVAAKLRRQPIYDAAAVALSIAMMDDDAQRRYLAIWGRPWTDVPPVAGDESSAAPRRSPRLAAGTHAEPALDGAARASERRAQLEREAAAVIQAGRARVRGSRS